MGCILFVTTRQTPAAAAIISPAYSRYVPGYVPGYAPGYAPGYGSGYTPGYAQPQSQYGSALYGSPPLQTQSAFGAGAGVQGQAQIFAELEAPPLSAKRGRAVRR